MQNRGAQRRVKTKLPVIEISVRARDDGGKIERIQLRRRQGRSGAMDTRAKGHRRRPRWSSVLLVVLALAATTGARARAASPLDDWRVDVGSRRLGFDTTFRLDSRELGLGTEIDFERDLRLPSREVSPSVFVSKTFGKGQQLGLGYFKADRDATEQIATEIRIGDIVFPFQTRVSVGLDWEEYRLDYTYFFLRRESTFLGVLVGVRWIDLAASFTALGDVELATRKAASAPLPYVGLDFRHAFDDRFRFRSKLAWLEAKVGDYNGSQVVLGAAFEYFPWRHYGLGVAGNYAGIHVDADDGDFVGVIESQIVSANLYLSARF